MAQKADTPVPADDAVSHGKGRATPSRAEQEAARKRPLAPDTKEAKAAARARLNEQRDRARVGRANGEEKYLTARDRGAQRRYVRDYVDAGWHIGEFLMPAMLVIVLVTMLIPVNETTYSISYYSFLALIIFVLFTIGDMIILGRTVKKKIAAKFGENHVEGGLRWYAAMRSMQMRWLRDPKPQAKRGQYPA